MTKLDSTLRKAKSLARQGDKAAAAELYLDVLERFPQNKRAQSGLVEATQVENPTQSEQLNAELVQIKELVARGHADAALPRARALVASAPNIPELHNELGAVCVSLSMGDEAEECYAQAYRLAPHNPNFAANYAALLGPRGKEPDAIAVCKKALAQHPQHLGARRALGRAYLGLGACEAAIAAFDAALALQPMDVDVQADRASAHFSLGDKEAAVADMLRVRAIAPTRVEYMRLYCHMADVAENDPVIVAMETALKDARHGPQDFLRLHFALAKVRHELGAHEAAFAHWSEANRISKSESGYDFNQDAEQFSAFRALAAQPSEPLDVATVPSRRPIFVVGMPRSGTSIVEQILSSHSEVHGAGEIGALPIALRELDGLTQPLTKEALVELRHQYFASVAARTPEVPWVVDKLMLNFRFVGQIAAAFPEARIIHVRRDPMATCWSNYRNYFPSGGSPTDFGNDLTDLGRYWHQYNDLIQHWDQSYPGLVHHLSYEALVTDNESHTRAMLDYIGLGWDPACIRFHENRRAVMTNSADQVRRKLYSDSSEEWRTYEPHLSPLKEALGATIID